MRTATWSSSSRGRGYQTTSRSATRRTRCRGRRGGNALGRIQGLPVPEDYGGSGAGATTTVVALEALGYGCKDNGLIVALNAQMWACEVPLVKFKSYASTDRSSSFAALSTFIIERGTPGLAVAGRRRRSTRRSRSCT